MTEAEDGQSGGRGHGTLGLGPSALGLGYLVLYSVDRGLILGLDSSYDSSRLIRTPCKSRGLPLVNVLDVTRDESRRVLYIIY